MAGRFSIEAVFGAVDRITAPVRRVQSLFHGLHRGVVASQRTVERGFAAMRRGLNGLHGALGKVADASSKLTGNLGGLARTAVAAGTAIATGLAAKSIVQTGAEFEAALSSVQAVAKLSRDELAKLANVARTTGPKFGIGPTQATEALETMIKAGYSATDAAKGLETALAAIVAAKGDVGIVEQLMSSVKGLGLANDQLGRVSDVFSKAADATKADVATVAQSMAKFGPVSRQFGFSLESTVGMIALLQDAGLDASEVGTSLASSFSKLAAPSAEAQKQIAKLGITLKDAQGNLLPPMQLLTNIAQGLEKLEGSAAKAAVIKDLVGLESQKALLNLTADMGKLQTIIQSLEGAEGYTGEFASTQLDNTLGSWQKLKATIDAVETRLFSLRSGALKGVIDGLTEWIDANQGLITSGFATFLEKVEPLVGTFIDSFKGAIGPIGEAVGGLLGLGQEEDWLKNLQNVAATLGRVAAFAIGVGAAFAGAWVAGLDLAARAVNVFEAAWGAVIKGIGAAIFWVSDAWANFAAKVDAKGLMKTLADGILKFASLPIDALKFVVKKLRDLLPFSPAKAGPLKDLDKIKIVETVASTIDAAPAVQAMERVAKGMANVPMPAINSRSLGSDQPAQRSARPSAPHVVPPAERSAVRIERSITEMRDKLEIVVRADEGTEAEVVQRPQRATVRMVASGTV